MGAALDSLAALKNEGGEPFDLVFIDADKRNTPEYFSAAVDMSHPGSLIVVDNVVRQGRLIDTDSDDPDTEGMRRLIEQMGADRRPQRDGDPDRRRQGLGRIRLRPRARDLDSDQGAER